MDPIMHIIAYNPDGNGVLLGPGPGTGIHVAVDETMLPNDPHVIPDFGMSVVHKNYLHQHWYCPDHRVHQGFDYTLPRFISKLGREAINPTMALESITPYVPDQYRGIVNGLLSFITYIHSRNVSLVAPLSLDNFVVSDYVVKYWKVVFCRGNANSMARDYAMVLGIIAQVLQVKPIPPFDPHPDSSHPPLPSDMSDLLRRLYFYVGGQEILLEKHLATMSHHDRRIFFTLSFDKLELAHLHLKVAYEEAIKFIGLGYGWLRRKFPEGAEIHQVLMKTLGHKYGGSSRRGLLDHLIHKYHVQDSILYKRNYGCIQMCRNLNLQMAKNADDLGLQWTDKEIELVIMGFLSNEMIRLQEGLHRKKLLPFVLNL